MSFGSGFPKSLDISKQLDKNEGLFNSGQSVIALKQKLITLFDASGKTRNAIDKECGFKACNYLSLPDESKRPVLMGKHFAFTRKVEKNKNCVRMF